MRQPGQISLYKSSYNKVECKTRFEAFINPPVLPAELS